MSRHEQGGKAAGRDEVRDYVTKWHMGECHLLFEWLLNTQIYLQEEKSKSFTPESAK